ncbi:MAG: hypothetical protein P8H56_06590 [Crocinitomicaceae bacterium]|nr:hypothetical protein [Crocinitomicaceae bacterium]MDG1658231.1 hypothetical protein [Crocinitomicaceae bacterium]
MRGIDDLTQQTLTKISAYKLDVLNGVSDGTRFTNFDAENAYKCVEWNYKKCGYRSPAIVVTENPLEMQMMFNFIKAMDSASRFSDYQSMYPELFAQLAEQNLDRFNTTFGSRLRSILRSKIGSRVSANLNSNFLSKLDNQLCAQLYSLFSDLDSQLGPKMSSELGCFLRNDLRPKLGDQLGFVLDNHVNIELSKQPKALSENHLSYLFTANFYSDCIYYWYEFLRNELDLELSINQSFQDCFELQRKSGICQAIYSEDLCVISKYPKRIRWNDDCQLHSESFHAIEWSSYSESTNLESYFLDGEPISSKLPTIVGQSGITLDSFITHSRIA